MTGTKPVLDDLNVCEDEEYVPLTELEQLKAFGWRVHSLINGYGRYLRSKKTGNELMLKDAPASQGDDPFADLPGWEPTHCKQPQMV